MIDRVQVSALIVVPLASVAVSLWLAGEPLSWTWLKSFGGAGRSDCARPQPGSRPAASDACPWRDLGLPGRALRCRPRLSLRLQMAAGRIELVAQGRAAGNLLRQGLGILLASHVRRLRPAQQRRDLAFQLGDQPARALIRHRTMLAGVGLELGAVSPRAWKKPLLQGWFVKRPILAGDWTFMIKSLWTDPQANRPAPSRLRLGSQFGRHTLDCICALRRQSPPGTSWPRKSSQRRMAPIRSPGCSGTSRASRFRSEAGHTWALWYWT